MRGFFIVLNEDIKIKSFVVFVFKIQYSKKTECCQHLFHTSTRLMGLEKSVKETVKL